MPQWGIILLILTVGAFWLWLVTRAGSG